MPNEPRGIVIFADVIDSRRDAARASRFLRTLVGELERAYPKEARLAPLGVTQGDELQALLAPGTDPFVAVVRAGVHPDAMPMRWAIVGGVVDPGRGRATERTGQAFLAARGIIERARLARESLMAQTSDEEADALLGGLGSLLPILLADLTPRQREVARLLLVEGLRRAEAADRLGVRRATISVMADRAKVREVGRLWRALASIFAAGEARAAGVAAGHRTVA